MSKSIYDEAVETLNKYHNQNYNSTNKDEVELANTINVILPNYVKQEKLLELYKRLNNIYEKLYTMELSELSLNSNYYEIEIIKLKQQIKELENDE